MALLMMQITLVLMAPMVLVLMAPMALFDDVSVLYAGDVGSKNKEIAPWQISLHNISRR